MPTHPVELTCFVLTLCFDLVANASLTKKRGVQILPYTRLLENH